MALARIARRAVCLGAAGCLLVGVGSFDASAVPGATAGSKAAASHLPLQFYQLTGKTKIVTSRHDHRTLSLDVTYFPKGGGFAARPRAAAKPTANLTVTLATAGNTESNQWVFSLSGSILAANPKKGTGHLTTGSKIAPYGAIHLTLKPAGKLHTENICAQERETSRRVELSGRLLFKTAPHAHSSLGRVGSTRHPFRLHADLIARYDKPNDNPKCESSTDEPCPSAVTVQYFAPDQPDGTFSGFTAFPRGNHDVIDGWRNTPLSKPHDAQRIDGVTTRADTMSITPQQEGASVTVTANGPGAAGSATLNAPAGPQSMTPDYCRHPSTESFYNATLAPDPSLRFHNKLGGTFAVPNAISSAVFFIYTRT
jgi:hypothetical protein